MPKISYQRTGLTGGTVNDLDGIDGALLKENDFAFVMTSANLCYVYRLNATSGATEVSPIIIKPDSNAGDKRWILFRFVSSTDYEVMFTISNPASSAATQASVVDAYSGVIITLTGAGNAQTIGTPTIATAGRIFTVVNNDTSTHSIAINGYTLQPGEAQSFIWDGTAWATTDLGITSIPVSISQGGTGQITAQAAIDALTAVAGATNEHVLTKDTATGNAQWKAGAAPASDIPSGTKMLFYADAAPTGWTLDNTLDDKLVYVTKGSVAGGQTGGGVHSSGTWTQPNHVHAGPSHTHTTSAMTLATTQIPAHTHIIAPDTDQVASGSSFRRPSDGGTTQFSGSTGGGLSHEHGATGADGTGNTGNGATANTWRPAAYCVIVCSKN